MEEQRDEIDHEDEQTEGNANSCVISLEPNKEMKEFYKLGLENNDWERLIRQLKDQKLLSLFTDEMTLNGDNVFHIAAAFISRGQDVLKRLVDLLPIHNDQKRDIMKSRNHHGNTVLHEVAAAGNLEAAKFLLDRFGTDLLEIWNSLGESPLYKAAALGHTRLVKLFSQRVPEKDVGKHLHRDVDQRNCLHATVVGQHFETALWLQTNYENLAGEKEDKGLTSLQLLAQMPLAFKPDLHKSLWKMLIYYVIPVNFVSPNHAKKDTASSSGKPHQSSWGKKLADGVQLVLLHIWNVLAKGWPTIYKIWKKKKNQKALQELTHLLVDKDFSWRECNAAVEISYPDVDVIKQPKRTKSSKPHECSYTTPLLMATSTGAVRIVEEILSVHPQAIDHVGDNEHNILHVAVRHRQYDIFELIKRRKKIMSRLARRIDAYGNTLLHQASDNRYYSTSDQHLSGPAMQLQDELRWVQRAKKIVPHNYTMHRNKENRTAVELFNEQHAKHLKLAQTWMKDTTQACTVVAVLVATLVFAAAYTVPGGNDPSNGFPIFLDSPFFWVFTIMDIASLACSLASVVMFLSILTSPFEYPYFRHSLPRKLKFGFALLFFSMITTMLAFSATIFLLINDLQKKWTRSLVYTVALLPVTVFALVQFPLYQALFECVKFISKKIKKIFPVAVDIGTPDHSIF